MISSRDPSAHTAIIVLETGAVTHVVIGISMNMNEFAARIAKARQEVRQADDRPMTSRGLARQRQQKKIKAVEDFCYRFSLDTDLTIYPETMMRNGMLAVRIEILQHPFFLRPECESVQVLQVLAGKEKLRVTPDRADAQFANRLLVALDDALPLAPHTLTQ